MADLQIREPLDPVAELAAEMAHLRQVMDDQGAGAAKAAESMRAFAASVPRSPNEPEVRRYSPQQWAQKKSRRRMASASRRKQR